MIAVSLVTLIYRTTGEFEPVFQLFALLAMGTLTGAISLTGIRATTAAGGAAE